MTFWDRPPWCCMLKQHNSSLKSNCIFSGSRIKESIFFGSFASLFLQERGIWWTVGKIDKIVSVSSKRVRAILLFQNVLLRIFCKRWDFRRNRQNAVFYMKIVARSWVSQKILERDDFVSHRAIPTHNTCLALLHIWLLGSHRLVAWKKCFAVRLGNLNFKVFSFFRCVRHRSLKVSLRIENSHAS